MRNESIHRGVSSQILEEDIKNLKNFMKKFKKILKNSLGGLLRFFSTWHFGEDTWPPCLSGYGPVGEKYFVLFLYLSKISFH